MDLIYLAARIIAIPALLGLPGYVIFSLLAGAKAHREELNVIDACFSWVFLSVLLTSLCALALAELGRFSLPWLVFVVDVPILTLALLRWRRLYPPSFRLKWDRWQSAVLVLLFLSGVLFFRPFENILGGRDGGVYVNTGVNIANTGAIPVPDPLFLRVPPDIRSKFLWTLPGWETTKIKFRFPGLYWVEERGIMAPQFLHLYPTWIAIFYAALGLRGGLLATSLSAWMAGVGVYLVGRELFRREVGATALALLTVNISQVWFARYANSEALFQLLFWGALLFWALFFRYDRPLYGVISGLGFGTCLLTKIEAVFLLLPVFAFVTYFAWSSKRKPRLAWFVLPLVLLLGWTVVHSVLFSYRYLEMWSSILAGYPLPPPAIALGLVGGISVGGAILGTIAWGFRRWGWSQLRSLALAHSSLLGAAILALMVGSGCFYFREGLSKLGWYLTPLGICLAGLGLTLALLGGLLDEGKALLLSCSLLHASIFLRKSMVSPDHIWAIRRFVPIVIPSAALFIAHSLWWLAEDGSLLARKLRPLIRENASAKCGEEPSLPWRWIHRSLSVILGGMILIYSIQTTGPTILHREFGSAIAQVQQVATFLPDNALIILDGSWVGNYVSLPLRFIHNRRALAFWPKPGENKSFDPQAIERVTEIGLAEGWPVFFISSIEGEASSRDYEFILVHSSRLQFPQLEHSVGHLPRKIDPWDMPYWVYQIRKG